MTTDTYRDIFDETMIGRIASMMQTGASDKIVKYLVCFVGEKYMSDIPAESANGNWGTHEIRFPDIERSHITVSFDAPTIMFADEKYCRRRGLTYSVNTHVQKLFVGGSKIMVYDGDRIYDFTESRKRQCSYASVDVAAPDVDYYTLFYIL